jgi:hypothetical protein
MKPPHRQNSSAGGHPRRCFLALETGSSGSHRYPPCLAGEVAPMAGRNRRFPEAGGYVRGGGNLPCTEGAAA